MKCRRRLHGGGGGGGEPLGPESAVRLRMTPTPIGTGAAAATTTKSVVGSFFIFRLALLGWLVLEWGSGAGTTSTKTKAWGASPSHLAAAAATTTEPRARPLPRPRRPHRRRVPDRGLLYDNDNDHDKGDDYDDSPPFDIRSSSSSSTSTSTEREGEDLLSVVRDFRRNQHQRRHSEPRRAAIGDPGDDDIDDDDDDNNNNNKDSEDELQRRVMDIMDMSFEGSEDNDDNDDVPATTTAAGRRVSPTHEVRGALRSRRGWRQQQGRHPTDFRGRKDDEYGKEGPLSRHRPKRRPTGSADGAPVPTPRNGRPLGEVAAAKTNATGADQVVGSAALRAATTTTTTTTTMPPVAATTTSTTCRSRARVRNYLERCQVEDGLLEIPRDYLSDPFNLAQLAPVVEEIGLYWRARWEQQQQLQNDSNGDTSVFPAAGPAHPAVSPTSTSTSPSFSIYRQALQLLLTLEDDDDDESAGDEDGAKQTTDRSVEEAAIALYVLVHQRYATSPRGLETVRRQLLLLLPRHGPGGSAPAEDAIAAATPMTSPLHRHRRRPPFGQCPNVSCRGMPLLPYGDSDRYTLIGNGDNDSEVIASSRMATRPSPSSSLSSPQQHQQYVNSRAKRYCPMCQQVMYHWRSSVDGCAWGPSFCHLLVLTQQQQQQASVGFPPGLDGAAEGAVGGAVGRGNVQHHLHHNDIGRTTASSPRVFGFRVHPTWYRTASENWCREVGGPESLL